MINTLNQYWYSWKPIASINNGIKSWNNIGWLSQFIGTPIPNHFDSYNKRAFAWEADPIDPTKSSPWHNYIYERVIDDYQWGARAFAFWLPYGDYNINPTTEGVAPSSTDFMKGAFGLTQVLQKKKYTKIPLELQNPNDVTKNISDIDGKKRIDLLAKCPAVWKGFKESIKALVEGNLIPDASTGRSPINEPCKVMVYISSCRGWSGYRYRSNLLWDSFYKECRSKTHLAKKTYADNKFYQYLDEWIADIVAMKGTKPGTENKLSITLDAISTSATPSTLELFKSMPDYRSDLLELADWYVLERLTEDFGIQTFYESRTSKIKKQAEVANLDDGGHPFPNSNRTPTGGKGNFILDASGNQKSFTDDKFCYPFVQSEDDYWLKEAQRTIYTNITSSDDVDTMWRLMRVGGYPPPTDNNGQFNSDVYGAKLTHEYNGKEYPITNGYRGNSPHARMWWTYALADSYRYLHNQFVSQRFDFVNTKHSHINCYEANSFRDGLYTEGAYNGVDNPDFCYWKLNLKQYDYRKSFDKSEFESNPSGYENGWWSDAGKSAWDDKFRAATFKEFISKFDEFVSTTAPYWAKTDLQKYPDDDYTKSVIQ